MADDPEFRDAFLQVERARQFEIVAEALAAAEDAEIIRRIKNVIEQNRKQRGP